VLARTTNRSVSALYWRSSGWLLQRCAASHGYALKPGPHQQQCRSNIVECYKLNDSFDKVEKHWTCSNCFGFVETTKSHKKLATKSNVASTLLPVASTLLLVWTGLKIVECTRFQSPTRYTAIPSSLRITHTDNSRVGRFSAVFACLCVCFPRDIPKTDDAARMTKVDIDMFHHE